jgi:hypothetical protein
MAPMDLSRRAFLLRGAAAAAGVAAAGAVGFPALSSVPAAKLSAVRRQDFRALVEALAASPRTLVEASRAEEVTVALAASYKVRPVSARRDLDALIDAIDDGHGRRRFASLSAEERLVQVAHRMRAREAERAPAGCLLREAVRLAAAPFYPQPGPVSVPAMVEAEAA